MESAALNITLAREDMAAQPVESPEEKWLAHCTTAVRRFLKNVVIIDNEPVVNSNGNKNDSIAEFSSTAKLLETENDPESEKYYQLEAQDDGLGPRRTQDEVANSSNEKAKNTAEIASSSIKHDETCANNTSITAETHYLDVRTVSDSFAEAGLACAFVLPELDNDDVAKVKRRSLAAAATADIVVLDWFLQGKSSALTQQILQEMAESDSRANGRLRLVCIYTGQPDVEDVLDQAAKSLKRGGIDTNSSDRLPNCRMSPTSLLIVLNKHETRAHALPETLVNAFATLSDGLVPSFALAAVGAVRNNIHHMLTRFGADLDAAYIGNRLITDPPEDVAELMRDLLVSECDNSLAFDSVAEDFLAATAIRKWIAARHKAPNFPAAQKAAHTPVDAAPVLEEVLRSFAVNRGAAAESYQTKVGIIQETEKHLRDLIRSLREKENDKKIRVTKLDHVNSELIESLINHGINEKGVNPSPGDTVKFEIAEKNRRFVCGYLAGSMEESKVSQEKFSRLVGLRKEAFGSHKETWNDIKTPTLTTGSILRFKEKRDNHEVFRYLLCLTPACDTLRLHDEQAFSFIEAFESTSSHNLVIKDDNNNSLYLKFDTKLPQISTFKFVPDPVRKRVTSTPVCHAGKKSFEFPSGEMKFTWMGELRYSRVVSEIGKITGNWMRIGVVDSEYLRIMAKT